MKLCILVCYADIILKDNIEDYLKLGNIIVIYFYLYKFKEYYSYLMMRHPKGDKFLKDTRKIISRGDALNYAK